MCLRTRKITAPARSVFSAFQSVERICVPSNSVRPRRPSATRNGFNPSNGFVCLRTNHFHHAGHKREHGFNPSNGFVCLRTEAREALTGRAYMFQSVERICVPSNGAAPASSQSPGCSFNPSNGFVCLRTLNRRASCVICFMFQSVERICVPSNTGWLCRRFL